MKPMRFKTTLTPEKLSEIYQKWYTTDFGGNFGFGQHICNCFLNDGVSFPELYYERVTSIAYELALQELLCG